MGKVMVVGTAERELEADECTISFEVELSRPTAAEAAKEAADRLEELLSKLVAIGLEAKDMKLSSDRVSRRRDYDTNEIAYEATKHLYVKVPADTAVVNTVRGVIELGMDDVSFSVRYSLSNEGEARQALLKDAIADSRKKAGFLADSIGLSIVGFDTANLADAEDFGDLTEENEREVARCASCRAAGSRPLSDVVKPRKISMGVEVKVAWLLG
jgi:uncharacterized protein YggE